MRKVYSFKDNQLNLALVVIRPLEKKRLTEEEIAEEEIAVVA